MPEPTAPPPPPRPLLLIVADPDGAVLAAWRMNAHSPGGLVRQVCEIESTHEVSAESVGLESLDPAAWFLVSAEDATTTGEEVCGACGGKIRAGRCRDCGDPAGTAAAAGIFGALAELAQNAETEDLAAAYTRLAGLALADAGLRLRQADANAQLYEAIEAAKAARPGKSWPIVDLTGGA
jgi:hypothetical protein